jgi:hypothetical protein
LKRSKLIVALAAGAIAIGGGVWATAALQPGGGLGSFERDAKARAEAARPQRAAAGMFRATVCGASPCVLVEAGGLAFLVGGGAGAADGLVSRGLMRADLDGVLLTDYGLSTIEGLPGLRRASLAAGRAEPLPVFGPDGVLPAIDGANLMLTGTTHDAARLTVGIEGEDQGLEGKVVFDSGVVAIRAFSTAEGVSRIYRFDFSGRSLLIAGCTARQADLVAAARGAKQASAIVAASSAKMLEIERKAARTTGAPLRDESETCMTAEDIVETARNTRLSAGLFFPLVPAVADSRVKRAWEESATIPAGVNFAIGEPGAVLDLTAQTPVIHLPD